MKTGGRSKPSTSSPHSSLVVGFIGPSSRFIPSLRAQALAVSQSGCRHRRLVDRLEEPEERRPLVVKGVVVLINDARDASDVDAVAPRDPELHLGMLEQRVGVGEDRLQVAEQRGDPIGVVAGRWSRGPAENATTPKRTGATVR